MPDEQPGTADSTEDSPTTDPDAGAKKALVAEREARKAAEKALTEVQQQLKELTDKDKSEVDRLREENAALTKERDDAHTAALRVQVAFDKGLSPAQAKRLVGSTEDELAADADEILEAFPTKGATPPPSQRPASDLSGGANPSSEPVELDPVKLAESVPRH